MADESETKGAEVASDAATKRLDELPPNFPGYRELSEEELESILHDHKRWLESDAREGSRANLTTPGMVDFLSDATNVSTTWDLALTVVSST